MNSLPTGTVTFLFTDIEGLASINTTQGHFKRATQLCAWSDSIREKINDHRPLVEQSSVERDLQSIKTKISISKFKFLQAEGQTMSMEQAITLAMEDDEQKLSH